MVERGVCHVIAAGPCEHLVIDRGPYDMLIAADGGYLHCLEAGIEPDLVVGDFDSIPQELASAITGECVALPVAKDDTDLVAALRVALERGWRRFHIYAAFGQDIAHSIGNIQCLGFLRAHSAQGVLHGAEQLAYLVTPESSPHPVMAPIGSRVSVFAFGGPASGVTERGLQWELDAAVLEPDCPLGVSNVVTCAGAAIAVDEGCLLVVEN